MNGLGRSLIFTGLLLLAVGLIVSFSPRLPWLGKLPGDILVRKENVSFYFPLGSCIIISLLLSFIMWLFRR
ncbi:MAG TPA: DUF2905 domain-containing protein [Desulfuromonadales bacterium]|nr:DUF2905 domain-containing protein [Desulfuromonadales bacterium]